MWWVWRQKQYCFFLDGRRGCSLHQGGAHMVNTALFLHACAQRDHNACAPLAARHQPTSHPDNTHARCCVALQDERTCDPSLERNPVRDYFANLSVKAMSHISLSALLSVCHLLPPLFARLIFLSESLRILLCNILPAHLHVAPAIFNQPRLSFDWNAMFSLWEDLNSLLLLRLTIQQ